MDDQKYLELEERIRMLEEKLERISFSEAKEITMQNCPIGDVRVGDDCRLSFEHCPIGSVMMDDLEDADSRIDDLEGRLEISILMTPSIVLMNCKAAWMASTAGLMRLWQNLNKARVRYGFFILS